MSRTIGYSGLGGTTHTQARLPGAGDTSVAPVLQASQKISSVNIRAGASGTLLVDIALYDVTGLSGVALSGAPRIALMQDVAFTGTGDPDEALNASVGEVDLSAYAGHQIAITANNFR